MVNGLFDGMKMHMIPRTDILVSELCLGTMTFGEQVTAENSYLQLDLAFDKYGINFVDSSDSFPGPPLDSTRFRSERILGRWLALRGVRRSDLVISTKVAGFDATLYEGADGGVRLKRFEDAAQLEAQVDAQLKRLGTDYIDVLHLGSPDRYDRPAGEPHGWRPELENPFWSFDTTRAQLEALQSLIAKGKIRHYALSDESAFGLSHVATTAHLLGLPAPVLLQGSYNLLEREPFESSGLLEACQPTRCNIGLMARSPLASGVLTGKYLTGLASEGDPGGIREQQLAYRLRRYPGDWMGRYLLPSATRAVEGYAAVCTELSLPMTAVALSFVTSRDFVTSTVVGATSTAQLEEAVLALNVPYTERLAAAVERVHAENWMPTRGQLLHADPALDPTDPATLPWGSKDADVDPALEELLTLSERYTQGAQG